MKIKAIKTKKITDKGKIEDFLDKYIKSLPDRSILVITSKVVSILEGRVLPIGQFDKKELIKKESEYYLEKFTKYDMVLTLNRNLIIPTSGIDESNGNNKYILWPKDPQFSANRIRSYLVKKLKKKNIGVLITDSKTTPLRWGTTGVCLSHSGFSALNDYIGKKDIFGRILEHTKSNIYDGLASAGVCVIGEGKEQTPIAVITDIPFVDFQQRNPTKKELKDLHIDIKDDLYCDILSAVKWIKGKNKT